MVDHAKIKKISDEENRSMTNMIEILINKEIKQYESVNGEIVLTDDDVASNNDMIKIMFVCHGNICRSPMAEFVLKDMLKKQGLSYQFIIASSATST